MQSRWCIMCIVYLTCAIGQLRAAVQAPVSGNETRVAGWGRPARWSASFGNDHDGCRRWWAGTVARPPSAQVSTVVRASPLRVHLSSPLRQSVRAYSERERLAGGMGGANLPYPVSRSQSRTSVNDAFPWKLYMPPGMCAVCAAM